MHVLPKESMETSLKTLMMLLRESFLELQSVCSKKKTALTYGHISKVNSLVCVTRKKEGTMKTRHILPTKINGVLNPPYCTI